jgi:hypothetical protein
MKVERARIRRTGGWKREGEKEGHQRDIYLETDRLGLEADTWNPKQPYSHT